MLRPVEWLRGVGRDVRLLWRSFRLLLRAEPRLGLGVLGLGVVQAGLPVAQLWLTRDLVNALTAGDARRALTLGAITAAVTLGVALLAPVQDMLATQMQQRGVATLERTIIAAGRDYSDLGAVERPGYLDDVRLVQESAAYLGLTIQMASRYYTLAFSVFGILLSLATLHPLIPVAILVTGWVSQVFAVRSANLEFRAMQERTRDARRMDYALKVVTEPGGAAEVRVFGLGAFFGERFRDHAAAAIATLRGARLRGLGWRMVGSVAYVAVLAGAFWYIAGRAREGSLTTGDVALYITGVVQAEYLTRGLRVAVNATYENVVRLRQMFPFLDAAGPRVAVPPANDGLAPPDRWRDGIALDRVAFAYPESERAVLDGVTLELPAGNVTALVGENGAGKSTLVKLLSRMYDPTEGEIRLDGRPYAAYDLAALRARLTVVYQDAARFAFTLADNIAVGDPAFTWAEPEAATARAKALGAAVGIDRIAAGLPKGYGQMLTHVFEGGVELSGGQWQLVTFARGLMREDATLAILDEPSSALDAERERDQIAQIRAFAARSGRAVLLISHRLSTVRWADQIVVLDSGRVVERGSHADLVARGGAYADLFTMQASRYREYREDLDAPQDDVQNS